MNGNRLVKEGLKEGEPQYVIPMGMSENEVIFRWLFLMKPVSQSPYSRTCIQDDYLIVFAPYLDAGGITAIFKVFLS